MKFYVSLDQDVQGALDKASAAHPGDPAAVAKAVAVQGTAHSHPAYPGPASDTHDISVIELPAAQVKARWTFTPATLPKAGALGALGPQGLNNTSFFVAGYGTQEAQRGPGGQTHPGGGVRMKAPVTFDALNNTWVRLAMTAPQGNGGACYGDSGGPNFATLGGKITLVATTITGDTPCYATNVAYRLDTPGPAPSSPPSRSCRRSCRACSTGAAGSGPRRHRSPRCSGYRRSREPRTKAAWPACCRSSAMTLTSRTPRVTGGDQDSSTTLSSAVSSRPPTNRMVCSWTASK